MADGEVLDAPRLRNPLTLALTAVGWAIVFDVLAWSRPVGVGLAIAGVTCGLVLALNADGCRPAQLAALGVGLFSALLAVRSSPTLIVLNVLIALLLTAVSARLHVAGDLRSWPLTRYAAEVAKATVDAAGGTFGFIRQEVDTSSVQRLAKASAPVIRGLLIAVPVLGIFGILFASADPVFESYVKEILRIRVSPLEHGLVVLVAGSLMLGVLRAARSGEPWEPPAWDRPRLGVTEWASTLVTVNLLFAAFLVVQVVYLFGGRAGMETAGLSYAEYARRGFFELVAVSGLVVGLVLAVDWLTQRPGARSRRLDLLNLMLIGQTGVVVASAVVRMRLYTDEFGLTELRLYTLVFMVWLAFVLAWTLGTVIRSKRDRFAFGAFCAGLVLALGLNLVNPDALIASVNLQRVSPRVLDIQHLASLSNGAIPIVVEKIDGLTDECQRFQLAMALLDRASAEGWRSTSVDALTARFAIDSNRARLVEEAAEYSGVPCSSR